MTLKPWEYPIPPVLHKYLAPTRVHVLEDCRLRFSQRTVFDDDHELQPVFASFGTEGEIRRFILRYPFRLDPRIPPNILVRLIAQSPKRQALALEVAQKTMKSPDKFGVFCLTEVRDCEQMWTEYADRGKGFVITFDALHTTFAQLTTPGRLGKVEYSDQPLGTFLRTMDDHGAGIFFRKRMKYAFEAEWRSIRALHRLEVRPGGIYLGTFDPACVREIIIRPGCSVEAKLHQQIENDARYRHVKIIVQGESSV